MQAHHSYFMKPPEHCTPAFFGTFYSQVPKTVLLQLVRTYQDLLVPQMAKKVALVYSNTKQCENFSLGHIGSHLKLQHTGCATKQLCKPQRFHDLSTTLLPT